MPKTQFWLMKSEPDCFSIDDLERKGIDHWDGVRNYQARNFMRAQMRIGDRVLFYHSSARPIGIAGLARVHSEAYPDPTAWDPSNSHFGPLASPENPRWCMVDVEFVEKFPEILTLEEMHRNPSLEGLLVLKRGMRLSIQPVEKKHFDEILKMVRNRKK